MFASGQYPLEQVVTHARVHERAKLSQDFLGDLSGRLFGAGRLLAYASLRDGRGIILDRFAAHVIPPAASASWSC